MRFYVNRKYVTGRIFPPAHLPRLSAAVLLVVLLIVLILLVLLIVLVVLVLLVVLLTIVLIILIGHFGSSCELYECFTFFRQFLPQGYFAQTDGKYADSAARLSMPMRGVSDI